jgi:hypothetical protein
MRGWAYRQRRRARFPELGSESESEPSESDESEIFASDQQDRMFREKRLESDEDEEESDEDESDTESSKRATSTEYREVKRRKIERKIAMMAVAPEMTEVTDPVDKYFAIMTKKYTTALQREQDWEEFKSKPGRGGIASGGSGRAIGNKQESDEEEEERDPGLGAPGEMILLLVELFDMSSLAFLFNLPANMT